MDCCKGETRTWHFCLMMVIGRAGHAGPKSCKSLSTKISSVQSTLHILYRQNRTDCRRARAHVPRTCGARSMPRMSLPACVMPGLVVENT